MNNNLYCTIRLFSTTARQHGMLALLTGWMLAALLAVSSAWAAPGLNASKSTVDASPLTVLANGVATSTITVTLRRSNGTSAGSGFTVTLSAGSGSSIISPASVVTTNTGIATFTVRDSVVEQVTYTAVATDSGGPTIINQKPVVSFVRAAPTVVKSFSTSPIAANGSTTLSITLTNPNSLSITGATFSDIYPANLVNTGTPALSNTCGGAATAAPGGGTLDLSGGTIPATGSCTVSVSVTSAVAGSYLNSSGAVSSTNAATSAAATATLVVRAISTIFSTVTASPTTVLANGTSFSTITVTLRDGANLAVSGKTVTLAKGAGSSVISAASGTSDVNGVVTFTVRNTVVETTTYTATDTTDSIVLTQTVAVSFINTAILKSFSTSPVAANENSILTVILSNATGSSVSGAGFSDTYPAGLVNAANPATSGSCGTPTLSGASGGSTLGVSGVTIAANSSCTVTVAVRSATSATYSNTATNTASITSTASLVVRPVSPTVSTVVASPTTVTADGVSSSTITVTLKDGAGNLVSGKTVTLSTATGSSVITALTNAGGVATFKVTDTIAEGPIVYSAVDTTDSINISQTASVTFVRLTAPTVSKSFSPTPIADYGTSTLTITLNNSNTTAITGVAFTDNYPSTGGLANTATLVLSNTCGGSNPGTLANGVKLTLSGGTIPASGSCIVSVQVTAAFPGTTASSPIVNSTGTVTSSNANTSVSASGTLTVVNTSSSLSTVVASPTTVLANNSATSTITVTLRDGAGNPVESNTVSLARNVGSSATVTTVSATTDANGVATFTTKDAVEELVTYTATNTTDGVVVTQTATVTFYLPATVSSINTSSTNPALSGSVVTWIVTFSKSVTGVSAANFSLIQAGGVSGAAITSVSGSGTSWTVTASTGSGNGTLGLNMVNVTGISPIVSTSMPYTGQVYTISGYLVSGVINTYYPASSSVAAGATSITLGAAIGASTAIAPGDLLLVMQMQDATIDITDTSSYGAASAANAGLYEYAIASNSVPLSGGNLTVSCALNRAYSNASATASAGQKKYQVIRVPKYPNATLSSTLAASAWNGSAGGVLAFDVTGNLALASATVNVNGMGFRGGAARNSTSGSGTNTDFRTPVTNLANGSKGEGIAGTPQYVFTAPSTFTDTLVDGYPNGSFARGAPANAGGGGTDRNPTNNDQNPGGGGGGNAGAGGLGGIGWCSGFTTVAPYYGCGLSSLDTPANPSGSTGGLGGYPVSGLGATRLTLGGGGGAGTTNNNSGTLNALSSSGAAGGGIVMIRSATMSGTATVNANGSSGDDSVRNDGSGGGGSGGAVLISTGSGLGGLSINARGGKGGDNLVPPGSTATPHGPGGGGGGGYVLASGTPAALSVTAGASGDTYNGGALFGGYGATAGGNGSSGTALAASSIPGVALGTTTCSVLVHHIEIQHGSGTGVTCTPSTLTIRACADAACSTAYTGGISGSLSATGTPTVNWGSGSSAFTIAAGSSSVNKDIQITTPGSVLLGATTTPAASTATTCNFGSPSCTFTASDAGFILTAPDHASEAASTLTIQAVKKADNSLACVAGMTGTKTVNLKCSYADPVTGTLPVRVAGVALNASASTAACDATGGNISLTFDATGVARPSLQYADVGKMNINASFTGTAGTLDASLSMAGSGSFTAAPAAFAFSAVTSGLIKAGSAYSATITAQNSLGATTPNFGKEFVPEGVTLTSNLVAPLGGVNPAIGNNVIAGGSFTNGVATVNNLSWGEVGLITMTAKITRPFYLATALTASGTSGNTGRFIPDHFDTVTSGGMPCPTGLTCTTQFNGFVYSGQALTTQVTAKNLAGSTTQNYDSSMGYSKLVALTAWSASGGSTTNPGGGAMSANSVLASAFTLGVATTNTPVYTFTSSPTTPTDIYIRAAESGGDGVTSLRIASSVEGGMKIVSGRYKIASAYGSELLRLLLTTSIQYWNGTSWVTSTTDSATGFDTRLHTAGHLHPVIVQGPLAETNLGVPGAGVVTVSNGVRSFYLNKPGVTGIADIGLDAPTYLLGASNGGGVNPSINGRVTFGVYKGNSDLIYQRERY